MASFRYFWCQIKSSIVERLSAVRVETVERIQQTSMVIAQATAVINEVSEDAQVMIFFILLLFPHKQWDS